ncbi:hypothetical protein DEI68_07880 [Salmonella enterica subsp. enterica serovar Poona]|nr:hypothetical protein [Salmonella enterica subsp. enterica serovar Poona]EHZ8147774.1 hypothetical protein [Salmonella enterica]EHZ8201589.1 hypothetical protein [Salmonella enterica]
MQIEFQDSGEVARLIITSFIWSWTEHDYLVDSIMLRQSGLAMEEEYFFIRKTTILSGVLCRVMEEELRLREAGHKVEERRW